MHDTAMRFGNLFFQTYAQGASGLAIIDVGAMNVNGTLRSVAPPGNRYIGVDLCAGPGVDVVMTNPYALPFEDQSVDICLSSSCLEHVEFFWLAYIEFLRVLKPSGLLYVNAPSNGPFHRHPVDCWRFYPDCGVSLQNWGRKNGYGCVLLESFIGARQNDHWNDFVCVFLKSESCLPQYQARMQDNVSDFTNGIVFGRPTFANHAVFPEDFQRLIVAEQKA